MKKPKAKRSRKAPALYSAKAQRKRYPGDAALESVADVRKRLPIKWGKAKRKGAAVRVERWVKYVAANGKVISEICESVTDIPEPPTYPKTPNN